MRETFEIKRGKQGRIGWLTAQVAADSFDAAAERQLAVYNQHCDAHGLMVEGTIHVEAQANWVTGCFDVTATAYVRDAEQDAGKRAPRRVRRRRAAA
jgi:hypothetical protein